MRRTTAPVLLLVLAVALATVAAAGAQPPPMNRSYEIAFVMPPIGDGPEEPGTACFTFTENELCIADLGRCAPWRSHLVIDEKRPAFKSVFRFVDDDGTSIEIHIRGLAERRGNPASSIGGVIALAGSEGDLREVINFGFSGRSVADCSAFEAPSE